MIDHARLRELFVASCDLPPGEQAEFLTQRCSTSPELRMQLESLLRQDAISTGILSDDHLTAGFAVQFDSGSESSPPTIEGYEIKRLLGQGGMGAVYLARQKHPSREVAIKVIRPGIYSESAVRRFDQEASVLARLQHPGIASVYTASTFVDELGIRPYIVMEYLDGSSLKKFIEEKNPSTQERLRIIKQICQATAHAHQRGVIHRDIKPGNILMTKDGQPKLVDFGIAKSVSVVETNTFSDTFANYPIGTIAYMSPEQIRGHNSKIDTRSDIYSIGIVAFWLFSGKLPFDLSNCSIVEAAEIVGQHSPQTLARLEPRCRGDISNIVMKAIDPSPEQRYQTVDALADDIDRHLANKPVLARKPSTLYLVRKFISRNKLVSLALATVAVTIIAATISILVSEQKQQQALEEAKRQLLIKQEINDFLNQDLLGGSNPLRNGNPQMKVITLIDRASEAIDDRFKEQPEVEFEIRKTVGEAYMGLNRYDKAEPHIENALRYLEEKFGDGSREAIEIRDRLATTLIGQSKLNAARELATLNLELAKTLGDHAPLIAQCLATSGIVAMNLDDLVQAESTFRKVLETCRGEDKTIVQVRLKTLHNLSTILHRQKKYAEAVELGRQVVEERIRVDGRNNSLTGLAAFDLGHMLWSRSRLKSIEKDEKAELVAEAESWFEQAIEIQTLSLGADNPKTIKSKYGRGLILIAREKFEEAEAFFDKLVNETKTAFKNKDHLEVINALNALGESRLKQKDYVAAAIAFEESFEMAMRVFGPEHSRTQWPLNKLSYCFRLTKIIEPIEHVLDEYGAQLLVVDQCKFESALGKAYAFKKDFQKAFEISEKIAKKLESSSEPNLFHAATNRYDMATYLKELGKDEQAEACREIGRQLHAQLKSRIQKKPAN